MTPITNGIGRPVGLLDNFEKGLERAVNGAFAKTFRSGLQPVEITAALKREIDTKAAVVSRDRVLVPEPLYANNLGFATILGIEVVPIPCTVADGYHLPANLASYLQPRTRAILYANPGNPTGTVYRKRELDQIAAHIDVTPTLLEMAGVEKPAGVKFDGMSLLPLLRGETAGWPQRTLFIQSHRGNTPQLYRNFAAITQQYKLMQPLSFSKQAPPNAPLLLFDIPADPGEERNLAAEKPEVAAELKAAYEKWFADVSSTRGYEPPKIQIGTEFENPVTLTRQDWRMVGPDGWGDESLGFWEVDVKSADAYEVTLRFPEQQGAGTASFALGEAKAQQNFEKGATSAVFSPVRITAGPGRLEASLKNGGETVGVSYVDIRKLN